MNTKKNILFVIMEGIEKCLVNVTEILSQGHNIQVEIVSLPKRITGKGKINPRGQFAQQAFINKAKKESYDLVVWIDHERDESIQEFQRQVKPNMGNVSLEHELLSLEPEYSRFNNSGVFCFTKPHYMFCVKNDLAPVKARWYKLDVPQPPVKVQSTSLVWIGTTYEPLARMMKKDSLFEYSNLFAKQYYKPYAAYDKYPKKGTQLLGGKYHGATGVLKMAGIPFWIMSNSTCYLDALMMGCIPIIYDNEFNPYFKETGVFNEVISGGLFYNTMPVKYISYRNLDKKLPLLKQPKIYEETLQVLKSDWLFDNYETLPSVSSQLLNYINKGEWIATL